MTSAAALSSIYTLDSSALVDWHVRFYPTDIFRTLVTSVESLIAEERFLAPMLVREEVEKIGTVELAEWMRRQSDMIVPMVDVLTHAQAIQRQFPGLLDPKAECEEADAYVIALARIRDGIVITGETPAAEKRRPRRTHYIPDVCRELGIPCINFLGLMRREGWRF